MATVRAPVIEAPPLAAATQIKLPPTAPVPLAAPPVLQPPAPAAAPREVFAGVTSTAKPEPKAALQVQTGGFAGASTAGGGAERRQVVSAGFGTAEVGSAPRTAAALVRTAGFGGGEVGSAPRTAAAIVRTAGFGDAVSVAPPTGGVRRPEASVSAVAQILEKPRPAYTEEARRLRIEGEVQLEVLFGASGEIHIVRVIRGLGHGLDENAVRAARSIRFLPARKEGQPVDSTATVHILFQLAS